MDVQTDRQTDTQTIYMDTDRDREQDRDSWIQISIIQVFIFFSDCKRKSVKGESMVFINTSLLCFLCSYDLPLESEHGSDRMSVIDVIDPNTNPIEAQKQSK